MAPKRGEATGYSFEEEQRERLAGIETTWDPGSRARLASLGLAPGWRCLEAGAGGGSLAVWMAGQVGPSGSVVAADLDTRHLEGLAGGALQVRRLDLRDDALAGESFDLVHERSVVSWLGVTDALEHLLAAVAPGGWVLLEDFDWDFDGLGGRPPLMAKAYDAILGLLETVGYDRYYGRTLHRRLVEAGLEQTGFEGRSFVLQGGSPGTAFERLSFLALHDQLRDSGALTQSEIEEVLGYLDDPANHVLTPVMFAAWGRKPAGQPPP